MAASGCTLGIPSAGKRNIESNGSLRPKSLKGEGPIRGSSLPPTGSRKPPPLPLPIHPVLLQSSETLTRPGSRQDVEKSCTKRRSQSLFNGNGYSNKTVEKVLTDSFHTGEIDLSNSNLKFFPDDIASNFDLMDTIKIDLCKNCLSEVSEVICDFSSLEHLNLYHNAIRTLTTSIAKLHNLVFLNLSRNMLSGIPDSLKELDNLEVLLLANNRLISLPDSISKLSRLMQLDVSNNMISILPDDITNLSSLCTLNVRRNHLTQLPTGLVKMKSLRTLDISSNRITHIPSDISGLVSLEDLHIYNNPLVFPPAEISDKGCAHLMSYLSRPTVKERRKRIALNNSLSSCYKKSSQSLSEGKKDVSPVLGSSPESCSSVDAKMKEVDWSLMTSNKMLDSGYLTTAEAVDNVSGQNLTTELKCRKTDARPRKLIAEIKASSTISSSPKTKSTKKKEEILSQLSHSSTNDCLTEDCNGEDCNDERECNSSCMSVSTTEEHLNVEHNITIHSEDEGGSVLDCGELCADPMGIFQHSLTVTHGEREELVQLRKLIESVLGINLPADLSLALSDGVILCQLTNHILPSAISNIHIPASTDSMLSAAERKENIEKFLTACRLCGVEEKILCSTQEELLSGQNASRRIVAAFCYLVSKGRQHSTSICRQSYTPHVVTERDRVVAYACVLCLVIVHMLLILFPLGKA